MSFLGLMVLHYLQSITPNLALGGELIHQQGPGVPGGHISIISAAGRYTAGDSTISGSLGIFFFFFLIKTLLESFSKWKKYFKKIFTISL